jgi:hypothetical protein
MSKINWSRVLGCGLLAGIVWIILGSLVTSLLGRDFAALPNNHLGAPTPDFLVVNVVLDLLEGISILWLYAAIRRSMAQVRKPLASRHSRGGLPSAWETPLGAPSVCFRCTQLSR